MFVLTLLMHDKNVKLNKCKKMAKYGYGGFPGWVCLGLDSLETLKPGRQPSMELFVAILHLEKLTPNTL